MSFPTKEERTRCWASRDEYWECLNENAPKHSSTSGEKVPDVCQKLRKAFEGSCPRQWVKHFDRKRTYEQFKERMEKGYDPLEEKNKGTAQKQS
ncbi:PREDICTED: cytochrome c oxidase assembly factor 6 homolog [Bactrocera latifrons]|uniref:cytochrome c oxidase assembly factor 6 homolog n=1 Tax=Bactrocera latifrons TaxID=174628 RepID=UPI0008DD0645|nr:PREDICTED: cytochrome c oxidase assembly factor 6 homolog [Bactrocera latifrons]